MKFSKKDLHIVFTIFVFVALASLDNAVIGLFPPLFSSIAKDLNIHVSSLGVISGVTIFTISFSSIFWGYLADKGKRKRLIIAGTIIWSISVFFTSRSTSFVQLLICQFFTAVGLGCIGTIGFSVLTDYIPKRMRGMLMSLWGMSQGFGGIAGSLMASLVSTAANWRKPFEVISILGMTFIFLYFFIREPKKGGAEPELREFTDLGGEYTYSIELSHIKNIVFKKSNKWLILQGLFMNITTGTLIWLPTLYISKIKAMNYSTETAIIAAGYMYAILQIGGLFSIYFGHLGDKLQHRTYRGRALLSASSVFIAMPLYLIMFVIPMNNLALPDSTNPIAVLFGLIREIAFNPWMFVMFILAVGATTAQSANSPNWLALITDVNLPEHRTTAFSIANLVNGMSRALGNVLIGPVLLIVSGSFKEPANYIITMSLFQLFLIPAVVCYLRTSENSGRDIRSVKSILKRRGKLL